MYTTTKSHRPGRAFCYSRTRALYPPLQQNNAAPAAIPIIPAQFDFDFDFPVDLVDRNAVFVLCILCFIFLLALSHVLEIF
jgi:hypothetical protein